MNPLAAALLALGAAAGAVLARWLRPGAGMAAAAVAFAHLAGAGWSGGFLLAVFVGSSSLLTRGQPRRRGRQVLANGGVAALGAALAGAAPSVGWPLMLGALATAQADTWATEVGAGSPTPPRDLRTGRRVPAGTSGAVSLRGTAAGIAGAVTLGLAALAAGLPAPLAGAGAAAGVAGMLVDSLIGTTIQARYICEACGASSERARHCGRRARRTAGWPRLDNDAVNALATLSGAALCWWLASS